MSTSESFDSWISQLKRGDAEAAQRLWERYFARLVELARAKLAGLSRKVSDEEDVALSAFASFCTAVAKERYPQLDKPDDLWQLLVMHTARKAVAQRRYQGTLKRGGEGLAVDVALQEVVGSEPDPRFAAEVADEFRLLLERLNDEELRAIALRKLEGYTNEEVAQQFECSLRSVERKLALIRAVWKEAGAG
jgi:RNA polymerase sigma factor (sigma-70 family)